MPRYFIIPANPARYDLATQMVSGLEETWRLTDNFRPGDSQMRGRDIVFMMRTKGRDKNPPRLFGWGQVLSEQPIPVPDWPREPRGSGKGGITPHMTRIRYMAVCERPVTQSEMDADPVCKAIRLQQGSSQQISEAEAASLSEMLRRNRTNAPEDGPDNLAKAKGTPASAGDLYEVERLFLLLQSFGLDTSEYLVKQVIPDSGPPPRIGSEDVLRALILSGMAFPSFRRLLPGNSRLFRIEPYASETSDMVPLSHSVSAEFVAFARWVLEISNVALGVNEPHPAAVIAAMLTKEPSTPSSCAHEILRRAIPDLADARRKWLSLTTDPDTADPIFREVSGGPPRQRQQRQKQQKQQMQ